MKNLLISLSLLAVFSGSLSAQTVSVAPYDGSHFNGVTYVNPYNLQTYTIDVNWSDTTMFIDKQADFLFGYHWGGGDNSVMERRWHINAPHDGNPAYNEFDSTNTDFDAAMPGRTVYYIPRHDVNDWFVDKHLTTPVMEWRPAAAAWGDWDKQFQPVTGDTSGAIFGFEERAIGTAQTTAGGAHFMDYLLQTSDLDSAHTPVLALRRPVWRSEKLRMGNDVAAPSDTTTAAYGQAVWNGTRWYLAVNMGRLNNDSTQNDTVRVLTVKLKWWSHRIDTIGGIPISVVTQDTVKFDSVFAQSPVDTTSRGITFRHLTFDTTATATALIIRRHDLPAYSSDDMNGMITLGAYFRTSSPAEPNPSLIAPNPWFKIGNGEDNAIDSFDIQVTYYGGCDVAVRHVSLQTPLGREMLFGRYDTLIARNIDRAVRQMKRWQVYYPTKKLRLFRFYGVDEAALRHWRMHRYYNKLMDRRLTTEVDYDAYRHAVPQRDFWSGSSATHIWHLYTPAVNKFHGTSDPFMPTYPGGWLDTAVGTTPYNYECRDCKAFGINRAGYPWIAGREVPIGTLAGLNRFNLCAFESLVASYLHNPMSIYGNAPNWTRHTVTTWYTYGIHLQKIGADTINRPYYWPNGELTRPQTGEELRRALWYSILLGTKGLNIADGTRSTPVTEYDTLLRHILIDPATHIDTSGLNKPGDYINFGLIYPGIGHNFSIAGDTVGEITIRSPEVGHDFITPTSMSNYWQYIRRGDYASIAGIDSTRIYIGLRSMRIEIMKMHDYILASEADIMSMRLMALSGKGFNWLRSARDNDTTLYTRYVNMGWNGVKTRTIGNSSYEPWDTTHTFTDITLHQLGETSMDSTFIIGVLNRHGNSLVMIDTNTAHPDSIRYKFYSTAEFDSLSALPGGLNRYAQLGSREISIPFSYTDANGRYALLRVRELGGGLDTVIGQDRSIIAKFLPGQGRFYKVEVLRSNEVSGDLSHSNQTKIVSHNLMRRENGTGKWVEGDSLVYYMTYHKPAPSMPFFPPRTAIYFRKSKPTSRWDNNAALQWESEYRLTDTVFHSGRWNIGDSCAYPSIVVRFDSTSEEYRAYIVYGCIKYDTTNNPLYEGQFITESIIRIRQDTAIAQILPGVALDMVRSRDMSEWGTPMINASDTVNFYCYSDRTNKRGIIAGWKGPDTSRALVSKVAISWANQYQWDEGSPEARHPSLNPYSPYIRGEKHSDAALVWQENNTQWDYPWRIMYTRLSVVDSQIVYGVSPTNNSFSTPYILNDSNKIWCVSCDTSWWQTPINHTYPVVYRELFYPDPDTSLCNWDYWFSGLTRHDVRIDNIAWQGVHTPSSPFFTYDYFIDRRAAIMLDTTIGGAFAPNTIDIQPVETIWSSNSAYVYSPTLSAGESEYAALPPIFSGLGGCLNSSVRAVALDFGYYPSLQVLGQPPWSAIYHTALPNVVALATIPITTVASGNTPTQGHLSARGSVRLNDWQRGRHIYNSDTLIPPTIRTSGREFYKRANNNPMAETMYGFGNSDSRFVMSALRFGGQDYPLQPKRVLVPSLFATPPDTLVTEWFNVGNERIAQLLSAGDAPEQVAGFIERRSDGQQWELPFGRGEKRRLARLYARLVNGGDEEYRLVIHRNSDIGVFRREIVLDNPFADEGLGRSAGDMEQMLDLGSTGDAELLTIFPNPVSDEVHIAIRGEECAEVIIVDAFGRTMQATTMKSGGVLTVATVDFAAGVYAVRVWRSGSPDVGGRFIVVR